MGCDPNALTASSALKCDIYLNYFKLFKSALKSPTGPFVDPMMKKKKYVLFFGSFRLTEKLGGKWREVPRGPPRPRPPHPRQRRRQPKSQRRCGRWLQLRGGGGASRGLRQPREDPCTPLRCHTEKRHRPGPAVLCLSPQAPGTHWSPYCLRSFASSRMS